MLNKQDIIETMKGLGFTLYATSGTSGRLHFMTEPSESNVILNVKVYLETEEFEVSYLVPKSMNILTSPKCSPFSNKKHFESILGKLEKQAILLQQEYDPTKSCSNCKFWTHECKCNNIKSEYYEERVNPISHSCDSWRYFN